MIRVNLLPEELRPIKRTPLPYIGAALVLLLALGGMAMLFLNQFAAMAALRGEIQQKNEELDSLASVVRKHNELQEQKLTLADKVEIIEEIIGDRKIWSKHLHQLATLTPDNIWYSRIRVTHRQIQQQVQKVNPQGEPIFDERTGEPVMETRRVQRPILEISGYVITNEQGERNIFPLTETTTTDPQFTEHFVLDSSEMKDTEFEGIPVRGFTLQYEIKTAEAA